MPGWDERLWVRGTCTWHWTGRGKESCGRQRPSPLPSLPGSRRQGLSRLPACTCMIAPTGTSSARASVRTVMGRLTVNGHWWRPSCHYFTNQDCLSAGKDRSAASCHSMQRAPTSPPVPRLAWKPWFAHHIGSNGTTYTTACKSAVGIRQQCRLQNCQKVQPRHPRMGAP